MIAPTLSAVGNSSYAFGFNDGPVWAGRGLTASATGGVAWRRGSVSARLAPVAFATQNAAFAIASNGQTGPASFRDWLNPRSIDLPQRFGSDAYARLDPGESHVRLDTRWISIGAATESEIWGPAVEHPMILGNNAGGIPRLFVGTPAPLDLKGVRVQGRVLWGRLDPSSFGYRPDSQQFGFHGVTAATGSLSFSGVPGLEVGAIRFFHVEWPDKGLRAFPWLRVFEGILKSSLTSPDNPTGNSSDNQLASLFFRWAAPTAGIEVYGEYGREDHSGDLRDLAKEPDHDAAYLIGFQRVRSASDGSRMTVIRAEHLNSRVSHLQQADPQTPWYVHGVIREGHTQRGQVLGSAAGYGGGASVVAVDRYTRRGRTTVRWDRLMQGERLNVYGLPVSDSADVMHALTVERMRIMRRIDLTLRATAVAEFNRHFTHDAANLNLAATVRVRR